MCGLLYFRNYFLFKQSIFFLISLVPLFHFSSTCHMAQHIDPDLRVKDMSSGLGSVDLFCNSKQGYTSLYQSIKWKTLSRTFISQLCMSLPRVTWGTNGVSLNPWKGSWSPEGERRTGKEMVTGPFPDLDEPTPVFSIKKLSFYRKFLSRIMFNIMSN